MPHRNREEFVADFKCAYLAQAARALTEDPDEVSDDQLVSIIFGGKRNHAWRKFEALIETVLPPEDFGPEGRWATSSPEEVAFQVLAEAVTRISSGEEIEAPFRPLRELQLAG